MFSHLLSYMPKFMYKNRDGALFGILFPFTFGLVYLFIFSGLISGANQLESTPVAMVFKGTSQEIDYAKDSLATIAVAGQLNSMDEIVMIEEYEETPLLTYIEVDSLEEGQLLADQASSMATIVVDNSNGQMELSLEIASAAVNNFSSSIVYSALTSYSQIYRGIASSYEGISQSDQPLASLQLVNSRLDELDNQVDYIVDSNREKGTSSYSIYFYAALAYLCIFFMSAGTNMIIENEAFNSPQALRASVSPVSKSKRFFASFLSWGLPSLLIIYAIVALYYSYGIPLGNQWLRLIILLTLGLIVGLLFGTALASALKARIHLLSALSIALPLVFGAFSGLMAAELKYSINQHIPWLNKINPVTLINDGIYYLNNYPTFDQYNQNVLILIVYIIVLLAITLMGLRRTDYANL